MKRFTILLPIVILLSITIGCTNEIVNQLELRKASVREGSESIFSILSNSSLTLEQKEAMQFLYAYMPLNDMADYSGDFFLKMVNSSLQARDTFSWGKTLPEDLFRHFVLPPRVNNEDLDSARIVFFSQLKDRIKNMSMYDAALEVNHWCHEKVTYRPSDSRTSSPLSTILSAYGRCGEESTFTVTALRAVGIPARQCYTPRWAHTDDNHAWVEVWCDGKWYFMGACEPEGELNKAWFSGPSARAMMVHTNVFGRYCGPESKTDYPLYTKINVLENYAKTRKLTVRVTDGSGNPVENAKVSYLLYNYAEYFPIYEKPTDINGKSEVISGLGDLLVWAVKDGKYGYKKVSLVSTENLEIKLDREKGVEYSEDFDIVPPPDKAGYSESPNVNNDNNSLRLRQEDSIREHYIATFMTKDQAISLAKKCSLNPDVVAGFIRKSEGNWKEISAFIENNMKNKNVLEILATLTDKDLRDTPADVLQSHLDNTADYDKSAGYTFDIYKEGILSPRISVEKIRKWRLPLKEKFSSVFNGNVDGEVIKKWVMDNISSDSLQNYPKCPISPEGVAKIYMADKTSRDIFYVALCRTFGIPAKIDPATSAILQYNGGKWMTVNLDPQTEVRKTGKLILEYNRQHSQIPQYWSYYTIAKMKNGIFVSLDFENDPRVASFPVKLDLEEGYYRLCTGNRYADGKVLAHDEYFNIKAGGEVVKELKIRDLAVEKKIYGKLNSSLLDSLYKDGGAVICFIEPDKEPTKHMMNELPLFKKEFDKWKGKFVFAVPSGALSKNFNGKKFGNLPEGSIFLTDRVENLMNEFLKTTNQSFRDNFPLIFIVNDKGEIFFHSQGYKIGLADLLLKSLLSEYSYICAQH